MYDDLYSNKETSQIVGLSERQTISWAEKSLIKPKRPAKKAGTRRGYDYLNLLEFGLARYLLDIIGVQFYTAKTILDELREDGEIEVWASDYINYSLSFARKVRDKKKAELVASHLRVRVDDPRALGGTVDFIPTETVKPEKEGGTLYYILMEKDSTIESIRIISPWDLSHTLKAFQYEDDLEDTIKCNGMIIINLLKIKQEILSRIPK